MADNFTLLFEDCHLKLQNIYKTKIEPQPKKKIIATDMKYE